jgi:hypothetical protein
MSRLIISILFVFLLNVQGVFGQNSIYKGQALRNNKEADAFLVLSQTDDKVLSEYTKKYLDGFGKLESPKKNTWSLSKIKGNKWSDELEKIECRIEDSKKINILTFFFLDKNDQTLTVAELKDQDAISFLGDLEELIERNENLKRTQSYLSVVEDDLKDAQKEGEKIRKSLEKNLSEQEKLGKKLDASPENMTKALAEKEEIVNQLYNKESQAAEEDLKKASESKEKEINKLKKEAAKAETKLQKKEKEFDQLKSELGLSKQKIRAYESIKAEAEIIVKRAQKMVDSL